MSGFTYKLYERMDVAAVKTKSVLLFGKNIASISKLISKPSYYPERPRKSKREMWKDNFKWLFKNGELNKYYTSYGLDVANWRNAADFISYKEFTRMRNRGNQTEKLTISGHYNSIILLRDKYVFSAYLASTIGEKYVVKNIALISNNQAFLAVNKSWVDPKMLLVDGTELVYKILDGECADGVMLVQVNGNMVIIDGQKYTKEEFVKNICSNRLIVQNVVVQHPDLKVFQTRSVNTIRIVTIKGKSGSVNVFAAFLRLSASSDSFVDNRAKGGLGIGISLDTGKLMKYGFPHDTFGVKLEKHPLSHIRFEGYQLPYWDETVKLVCAAHKQFYDLQSIGWDVVLTENGPILLEGNDDWEIGGPQDTYGGLKKRWNELTNA